MLSDEDALLIKAPIPCLAIRDYYENLIDKGVLIVSALSNITTPWFGRNDYDSRAFCNNCNANLTSLQHQCSDCKMFVDWPEEYKSYLDATKA